MNKEVYLNKLREKLSFLPNNEVNEIIDDYEMHFEIGKENGKSEEEIVVELGDVDQIAKQFSSFAKKEIEPIKEVRKEKKKEPIKNQSNGIRAFFVAIGMIFLNMIFVLGPFIAVIGVLIGFIASSVAISLSGVATMVASFVFPFAISSIGFGIVFPVVLFTGLGLSCLGVLWTIGNIYLVKFFFRLTIKYLRWNVDVIKNA